ncbi:MAG TPA: hypothetical protein VI072_14565 [Polyangiaceae bacterium]
MKRDIGVLALLLATTFGCSSEAGDGSSGSELILATPSHGVQIHTRGLTIPAGSDEEWCEVVELPGSPDQELLIGAIEIAMTPFSHHLIVSVAPEGSASLADARVGERRACQGAHVYGPDLLTLAAAASPRFSSQFPPGVGQKLRGGQKLVFDYHYLNTSDSSVVAQHKLNLHFIDAIDRQARVFGFYNQYLDIAPRSSPAFADECRFKNDVSIWSVLRHTHRRGTDFDVWWAGGERDGQHLWKSTNWEQDITFTFDEPVRVKAGEGFRWRCAFDNPSDEHVIFGPEATDEMCILFGQFAAVAEDSAVGPQSCYRFSPSE